MKLKKDISFKKERGGYYTPEKLANFITSLLYDEDLEILEPSCGDGVFLSSILEISKDKKYKKVDAVEIVKEEYDKCVKLIANNKNINLYNDDFYKFYQTTKEKYDLILGNPPVVFFS